MVFSGVCCDSLVPRGVLRECFYRWQMFRTDFTLLYRSTYDVILGTVVLQQCGATVDCRTGGISLSSTLIRALVEDSSPDVGALSVSEDVVMPAISIGFV